jgi:hypothetical protein
LKLSFFLKNEKPPPLLLLDVAFEDEDELAIVG